MNRLIRKDRHFGLQILDLNARLRLRHQDVRLERRQAPIVRELRAAIVCLRGVRQDLDEHDGIRHGICILGRGFHLVAHNRDVWVR